MVDVGMLGKIDLHCHLDGSLTLESVRDILGEDVGIERLQVGDDCGSLAEYLERFDLPIRCIQTEEGLIKSSYGFLKEVSKENIRYIEVRFAPLFSVNGGLSCERVIESVIKGLEMAKQETGTHYNVITCAMRNHGIDENIKMIKTAREFLGAGVCAADLAGDEAAYPMKDYFDLFKEVKRLDMPFTLHAGECHNAQNIVDSVECGAKRIGHGIAMGNRKDIIKLCRDKRIGVEMCPISNFQTKAVMPGEAYPMREFIDEGLLVTINTDNRTVSNTSISKEIEYVKNNFMISDEEIIVMMKNAVDVAFASDDVKNELLKMY